MDFIQHLDLILAAVGGAVYMDIQFNCGRVSSCVVGFFKRLKNKENNEG